MAGGIPGPTMQLVISDGYHAEPIKVTVPCRDVDWSDRQERDNKLDLLIESLTIGIKRSLDSFYKEDPK